MCSSDPAGKRPLATGSYEVCREKITAYALAVGESNPLYFDPAAAREAGFGDLVAPPMFVAVYAGPVVRDAYRTEHLGIDLERLVHGSQEFSWNDPVIAGDELETSVWLRSAETRGGLRYFCFHSRTVRQDRQVVCTGEWLTIERTALPTRTARQAK